MSSLYSADARALNRPFRHQLAAVGPAATFDWLTPILAAQPARLRGANSLYLAFTGDRRGLEWIAAHASAPVHTEWGVAAAMLGVEWPHLAGWLRTNGALQLVALDALLAYRPPAPTMAPMHQRCAPVLPGPPPDDEVRLALAEVVAERNTPRVRDAVQWIDRDLDAILRGGEPGIWPHDLPALFA
ncbi:MAG: hypothetical protein ACI9K2_000229 [Myxococcota bacterium]